jgi:acyl-CoA thioesterase
MDPPLPRRDPISLRVVTEASRFPVEVDGTWSVGGIPNGGYLLALMLRCARDASAHPHPVATSAHFLRPPSAGPAEVLVETLRSGRLVTSQRVRLVQGGRTSVEALATSTQLSNHATPQWSALPPTPLPPVEECVQADPDLPTGVHVGLLDHLDLRLDPATIGWFAGHPAGQLEMRGWLRLRDGTSPDPFVLALAVDGLPPTVFGLGRLGWAPTIELTFLVRGLPAPGWLSVHVRGRLVQDGWFDEEAEVYDSAGRLVAQSRQLARVSEEASPSS